MFAEDLRTTYVVKNYNFDICDENDNIQFPSVLSLFNNIDGNYLRKNNMLSNVNGAGSVMLDLNNLSGSCDEDVIASIIAITGSSLEISTGDLEFVNDGEIVDAEKQVIICTPDCVGKTCGDDGCGGSCGTCGAGESCISDSCVSTNKSCYCRYDVVKVRAETRYISGHLETKVKSENSTYPSRGCNSGRILGNAAVCAKWVNSPLVGMSHLSYHAWSDGFGQPLNGLYHQKRLGNRYDSCWCTDTAWSCWMPGSYCPEAPGGGESCRPNTCSYPARP